jgi:pimeloyl-ACP methyl ester carboxylesterase
MSSHSFSERDVMLATGVLRVRSGGEGRPVVHLHSAAGPRVSPLAAALVDHHTVHQPIAPGFDSMPFHKGAESMQALADVVASFIRDECGGKCDLIGESFGGWAALWVAAKHPDMVWQMVLEAPAGLRPDGKGGLPEDSEARQRALHAQPARAPKETRSDTQQMANRKATLTYTKGAAFDAALAERLPSIKARTLILMGTQDLIIPAETGHLLKSVIPQSHLTYIHGAAHALEFDQPKRVSGLVLDFLDRGESFLVREKTSAIG